MRRIERALIREITRETEINEPRIKNLAVCLGEDLQLAQCTHLQAIIALTVALRRACLDQPAEEVVRKVVGQMIWPEGKIITNDGPEEEEVD